MADIINFPVIPPGDDDAPKKSRLILRAGIEFDESLAQACGRNELPDEIREETVCGRGQNAFYNVLRLIKHRPRELVVFCTTLTEDEGRHVPWGDIYGLTDPPDTFRYLFTLYTERYVLDCRHFRGEIITPSAEDVVVSAPSLTLSLVKRGVMKWIARYYPNLKGFLIRMEDLNVVAEMIASTLLPEPDQP
jgi:hypothetical protein